ncbi:MAG: DUF669 domain-containing protein, partial [Elusimicrobia bacterium]|nr:DUF669 domain-containing protein [Elusimicrobiota bacterium]
MPGKYNANGVEPSGGGGQPIPEGDYHLRIMKTEAGTTRNGDDKVTVDFKVVDGAYVGRPINYHTVSFLPKESLGAGMTLHFLKCIGEPYQGEFEWDESRWIARVIKAHVVIGDPDAKGRRWNKVDSVMEPEP